MKIEHVAFNVQDPAAMAAWYVEHLSMTIVRTMDQPPFTHFLADDRHSAMIELYRQPSLRVPDYRDSDPLQLHVAFTSEDVAADRKRLMAAGAVPVGEVQTTDAGATLAMLRDPWGMAVQLVQRAAPMTGNQNEP